MKKHICIASILLAALCAAAQKPHIQFARPHYATINEGEACTLTVERIFNDVSQPLEFRWGFKFLDTDPGLPTPGVHFEPLSLSNGYVEKGVFPANVRQVQVIFRTIDNNIADAVASLRDVLRLSGHVRGVRLYSLSGRAVDLRGALRDGKSIAAGCYLVRVAPNGGRVHTVRVTAPR